MTKNSIGSFLAALRKARGMTQQEVADRLNVSNKTVSKWERDEGYPEITMIPALAELFDVTADEILRGERLAREESVEKATAKAGKQLRFLLNRAMTRFKNLSYAAMALIFTGFNAMLTISYAAYRPVIGLGVMLALTAAGGMVQMIAVNGALSVLRDNELLEEEKHGPQAVSIARHARTTLTMAVFTVVLSLPLVIYNDPHFVSSVLRFGDYLRLLPWFLLLAAALSALGAGIVRRVAPLNAEARRQRKALNKKFAVILLAVAVGTGIGYVGARHWAALPDSIKFASREEMNRFLDKYIQYKHQKELALSQGWIFADEGEYIPGDFQVFYVQHRLEKVVGWDREKLEVYTVEKNATQACAVDQVFAALCCVELAVIGAIYLRKRGKLAKQ